MSRKDMMHGRSLSYCMRLKQETSATGTSHYYVDDDVIDGQMAVWML